jgi:hypothetical protein
VQPQRDACREVIEYRRTISVFGLVLAPDPAGRRSGFNDQRIPTARVLERLR